MEIKPIAIIHNDFKEKFGIPRQSGRVEKTESTIVFENEYRNPEAVKGLEEYSHIWLIFDFSLSHQKSFSATVRPPRLGGNIRKGVFATRSPFRPNSIGLSCVKLKSITKTKDRGMVLTVMGADLADGTPIYDIKPYIPYTDSHPEAKGSFSSEHENDFVNVNISQELLSKIDESKREGLILCLQDDPRPSYHDEGREYGMRFASYNIKFYVKGESLYVTDVETIKQ